MTPDANLRPAGRLASILVGLLLGSFLVEAFFTFVDRNASPQVRPVQAIFEVLLGMPVLVIAVSLILGLAGVGVGVRRGRRARDSEDDIDTQVDEYLDNIDADVETI